ncbi:MAG: hypothetical protein ABFE16_13990 [Armatimonadia bacterium]
MRAVLLTAVLLISLFTGAVTMAATLAAEGMMLEVDDQLRVTGLEVSGARLPMQAAPMVSLAPVETGQYVDATVTGGTAQAGVNLNFVAAQAQGTLTISPKGPALHFAFDLKGADLPARGMLLRFAFPVDATGWQWYSDMQTSSPIQAGKLYENVVPLRAYADLPEWKDKPALRMGYSNRNFCTVIAGPQALCLSVPLDRPCIFRTDYDATGKRLEILYDFALSPDTRQPNQASFAFDLYPCDPQWGMRSALARYYEMYPEMFKVYVPQQGQWMAFNRLSEIDNANEFWFGLQEGAPEPEYDDKIDVMSTIYYTHAGMPANLPAPYDPEKDPLPPYEDQVAAVNQAFQRTTGQAGLYDRVGTRKPDGRLAVEKWSVYGHLLAQFNLDPELPWGDYLIRNTITRTESIKRTRNGDLDGFYYDGLSAGLNYNTQHFKTHDAPVLWDPVNKKPYLNNFFSSVEFARGTAELLRPRGQITMMNGALGDSFYVCPWLDVLGAETGLIIPRESFNYIRTVIHHKPFMTLLKGNYEKSIARPQMELFMKRCLAYGVFPGFFDWPPSGLGPGGQYWNHPRYYERDRDLFRRYEPLCRSLALAGWEPVTFARSSDPGVYVERFGPDQNGVAWLTLLNEEAKPHSTTLTIDAAGLGLDAKAIRARDLVSGKALPLQSQGKGLVASLEVPPDGVLAIQLATPAATAKWHLDQSLELLDRGTKMRQADAGKGPQAVHWRPLSQGYDREIVDGKTNLVFKAGGRSLGARQWAMLFQSAPGAVKLQARVAADKLAANGDAKIRCRLAWVTPSYTHYETQDFALPDGTYDWKDVEFEINSPQALRSIEVTPLIGSKATGTIKLARLSLSDASREYLIDPEFTQWYEPLPTAMLPQIDQGIGALRQALLSLGQQTDQLSAKSARDALASLSKTSAELRRSILTQKAENGCRRVLRDLQSLQEHVDQVTLASYNLSAPSVEGPVAAAPGDVVTLKVVAPEVAATPMRVELASDTLKVNPSATGGTVTIPATAQPGDSFTVSGRLYLGQPGQEISVSFAHNLTVQAPLELTLKSEGMDPQTGAARLRATVRNNRVRPVTAQLQMAAPAGWEAEAPAALEIAAGGEATRDLRLTPTGATAAGSLEVTASVTAGKDLAQARQVLLYIPPEANLLRNPSFESKLQNWSATGVSVTVDEEDARSGKASLLITNAARSDSQVSQTVTLNQKMPCPILLQASSKSESVEGTPGKGYSLYVDIYYMDGTPLYGTTFDFKTGTTDWQLGELYIEPTKPIRNVNVYLLLRGKSGKARFDDIALMEDPRRKGNVARQAKVTVDSSFNGYDASPINDGVISAEGLHWTKEAWASADDGKEHFVEVQFPAPVTVGRAMIYWSLDAGVPRTSQEVRLQAWREGAWQALSTARSTRPTPQTEIKLDQPVTADRFRLLQPAGQGPLNRTGLMWVRELELMEK